MEKKIERAIEHLENLKEKEIKLYNKLNKEGNNKVVSFGKIQAFDEVINFVKSEFS